MLKFLASVFILLSFTSCGVDTSSSTQTAKVEESTGTDTGTDALMPPPLVELNPIADANSTVPDDGTIDPGDGTDVPTNDANQEDSIFDITGAIEDKFACKLGDVNAGYTANILKDSSNDYLSASDIEDGIGLSSRYPYNVDITKTEVAVFYYDLTVVRSMDVESIVKDDYSVSIDTAWANNDKNVLYVRTPKDANDLFGCYRYELGSLDVDGSVKIIKVYSINN